MLIHLVDANNEDVGEAYAIVREELDAYGAGLEDKVEIVVLNKSDTIDDELAEALSAELAEASGAEEVLVVSGATGDGVELVLDAVIEAIGKRKAAEEDSSDGWSPV